MATTKTAPKRTAAKKPARDRSGALYAMVGDAMLARLDAEVARRNGRGTGPKWSRQDLVNEYLAKSLDADESAAKAAARP